jgi:signal transduction histidine kinase
MARGLYPFELEAHDPVIALQKLAARTEKLYGISCFFESQGDVAFPDFDTAVHVYRICQEALRNAITHGKAKEVWIHLHKHDGHIHLRVKDRGIGIPDERGTSGGMGLRIMNYRARMIRANLSIQRGDDGGTVVVCRLPQERV